MTFPPASMLSDGFFLSLSLCLDIGLVNVAMLSLTLSHGFRPGFWLGIGSCVGDLVYAALALGGMAVLLQFEPVRWIVWIGGGAVLLFLTWKMARALTPAKTAGEDACGTRRRRAPAHGAASCAGCCSRCRRQARSCGSRRSAAR